MKILGISSHYHDSAASLVIDGKVVAAAQEERFTRKKHDPRFPILAIQYCLKEAGLKLSELDAVAYYEKPLQKFDRILETYIHSVPFGHSYFVSSFPIWIKEKLFLRGEIHKDLKKIDSKMEFEKILFSEHHLSHAASAFFPSPFEEALVLTLDGVGEWATSSVAVGQGSQLSIKKETHFPHSLGFLYSAVTAFCGFKVNSGEYKLMGLAPYGEPKFKKLILKEMVSILEDGSFMLNLSYFAFLKGQAMFSEKMAELFKTPPRTPEQALTPVYMDIAASVQAALEEILLMMTRRLHADYGMENLCMAGGVALNCVANSKILGDKKFKKIWIQPAAGDAGGSLGAALGVHHLHFQKPRRVEREDAMNGAYLGTAYSDTELISALNRVHLKFESVGNPESVTAGLLAEGLSVGWFQGRMEFGPRALGCRSIIADARHPEMQKKLNLQIKFRESFRPFAPAVLEEDVGEWFDFDRPSPYMLFVADVAKKWRREEPVEMKARFGLDRLNFSRSEIPAVTHLDYSARLQTVSARTNPRFHALISEFKKRTGCPVVVNTSFNVRGEPIVESPEDAIRCFLGTDLDVLVLGNQIVRKTDNKHLSLKNYHQNFDLD